MAAERVFRMISLNVGGLKKLVIYPVVLAWLSTFAVICLQETYDLQDSFTLDGFTSHYATATASDGRPNDGLVTLINNRYYFGIYS